QLGRMGRHLARERSGDLRLRPRDHVHGRGRHVLAGGGRQPPSAARDLRLDLSDQRISLRSMNLIARRHETSAKPIRKARCPMSGQPTNPNTACRTSSTQWNSGLKLPSTCAQVGSWSSGKNVPATRNMGVSRPLGQYEKLSILSDLAAMKMPKQAHPNPARAAIPGTSSMPQLGFSPKTTATSIGTHP